MVSNWVMLKESNPNSRYVFDASMPAGEIPTTLDIRNFTRSRTDSVALDPDAAASGASSDAESARSELNWLSVLVEPTCWPVDKTADTQCLARSKG